MSDPGKGCYPSVVRFIRKLRGGSQAVLAEADDGLLYVVKFTNNLQGPNVLFNESIGSELYRACSLPIAEWTPVRISATFLNRNRACWMETATGFLKPSCGLAFGSRFLGDENTRLFEMLPASRFGLVRNLPQFWLAWMVDICAEHGDNRQAIFQQSDWALRAVFIDHGHLFGGPLGEKPCHFSASRYLDTRVYPALTERFLDELVTISRTLRVDELWKTADCLPEQWKTPSAVQGFANCLEKLTDSAVLTDVVQSMVALQSRMRTHDEAVHSPNLHAGLPSRRAEHYRRRRGDRVAYA
jgi:hypothetical protein